MPDSFLPYLIVVVRHLKNCVKFSYKSFFLLHWGARQSTTWRLKANDTKLCHSLHFAKINSSLHPFSTAFFDVWGVMRIWWDWVINEWMSEKNCGVESRRSSLLGIICKVQNENPRIIQHFEYRARPQHIHVATIRRDKIVIVALSK